MVAHVKEVDTALSTDEGNAPESRPPTPTPPSPPPKRGRGRPKTVVDFKEAKKKYNADHYQRLKAKRLEVCKLDSVPVETEQS
jgi:hypothetical protein